MFAQRAAFHRPTRAALRNAPAWRARRSRHMSTTAGGQLPPSPNLSPLASITTELDRLGPRITVRADQVEVLGGPNHFYETLKAHIQAAKSRIYLSTLYIGKSEHELVACLRRVLRKNPKLKVSILTDALRGTRETPDSSCASLLAPLAADFPNQVEIRMYHTPNLTGFRKRIVPRRINEGWGLQHMKLYGVDDKVILSGANLSNDYFTNRQDRYHVFSSKPVSNYFARVHDAMCNVSFLLKPGPSNGSYSLEWPSANASPSPLADAQGYVDATTKIFKPLVAPTDSMGSEPASDSTILYPVLNIPGSLNTELPALEKLITTPLDSGSSYLFTAGYFNPHPSVTAALLSCSKYGTKGTVLTASPWANGFYGSKGVSGMLPAAYTLLSRRFLQAAAKYSPGNVELREWRLGTVGTPDGWTYHAKGLWLTLGSSGSASDARRPSDAVALSSGPSVTIIGSSNYTTRSYSLDTEVGVILVTRDAGLQAQLKKEEENLLRYSEQVREEDLKGGDRRVGLGVRVAMWIVRAVGGSL